MEWAIEAFVEPVKGEMFNKKKEARQRLASKPTKTSYPTLSRFFGPKKGIDNNNDHDNDEIDDKNKGGAEDNSTKKRKFAEADEQEVIVLADDSSVEQDNHDDDHLNNEIKGNASMETKEHQLQIDGTVDDNAVNSSSTLSQEELATRSLPPIEKDTMQTRDDDDDDDEAAVDERNSAENPFSQFAFAKSGASPQRQGSLTKWMQSRSTVSVADSHRNNNIKKSRNNGKKPRTFQSGGSEWVKMEDLPKQERDKILAKWHGFADPHSSLEDRRFQILVAARLHARCQEPVVRTAMTNLRDSLQGDLSVQRVAKTDPKELAPAIHNLQYYNTKAMHIVKAAQEIKSSFGGLVPESEHLLKQLTGVGPVIADLLAFVNTRARHTAVTSTQNPAPPTT